MFKVLNAMPFQKKRAVRSVNGLFKPMFALFTAFFVAIIFSSPVSAVEGNIGQPGKYTDFITMAPGKSATYKVTYKNTGDTIWRANRVNLETGDFLKSPSSLQHADWKTYYRPLGLTKDVKPGGSVTLTIPLSAPKNVQGDIQQNFQLVDNGERPIKGTTVRLFATVKQGTVTSAAAIPVSQTAPVSNTVSNSTISNNTLSNSASIYSNTASTQTSTAVRTNPSSFCSSVGVLNTEQIAAYANCNTAAVENDSTNGQSNINYADRQEPMMRIGLFSTSNQQRVNHASITDVYGGTEPLFSGVSAGETIALGFDFATKQYIVTVAGMTRFTAKPARIVPRTRNAVATLLDYRNGPVGSGTARDNQFRNIIEMQYSTKTCKLWLINELPLSYYLKGLGETSNASPIEFQKVMLSAARTYAMYHYNRGVDFKIKDGSTKHADEHFHLDSTYDQVYRGYNSEMRMPGLSQAENQTRGLVITYQGKVIVTPYFSRSDGRTRSWTEVWGGQGMPWLQSVAVPQDLGQALWGHGVGMSARGALLMVVNEKKSWDYVIRYFYQGTDIQKIY